MYNNSSWNLGDVIHNSIIDVDIDALLWSLALTAIIVPVIKISGKAPIYVVQLWKEYGPSMLDAIFAFPLVHILRRLYIYFCNFFVVGYNRPSVLILPDELLLEVCLYILSSDCPSKGAYTRQCKGCASSKQSLANLSKTNKRMRHLAASLLLRTVRVGQGHGWRRASRALGTVENSLDAKHMAKTFHVDIYAGLGKGVAPPSRFAPRLALVLPVLWRLEKIVLVIPEYHTEAFRKAFEEQNVDLPNVRTLVLGPHTDWIVSMCPNVEVISTHDWRWLDSNIDQDYKHRHSFDLIRAAGRAEKLRHFEMLEYWKRAHLRAIRKAMPNLQSLAMPGPRYCEGFTKLLPILADFRKLQMLALAAPENLKVGFDNPAICGGVIRGDPERDAARRRVLEEYDHRVAKERREASQQVARKAFGKLKDLRELWVGDEQKATITRSLTDGVGEIAWAYEHRLKANSSC